MYLKKSILLFLLLFSTIFSYGQIVDLSKDNPYQRVFIDTDNFGTSYLDILEEAHTKVTIDSVKFAMLNDLSYYWHTRNLNKALEFTKQGLELTSIRKDTLWHGRFQITQGAILLRMEKLDSAQMVLEEALIKVQPIDQIFLNTQLGYVFERRSQLDKAADYVMESLRLAELHKDKRGIAMAYSDLSNLVWKQNKFKKGLEYGLKAISLFEERRINDLDYDFTLYVVGNNYLALKDYEEAKNYYNHAISIGERYGFYNNLCDVYISLVDLHALLNQTDLAEAAGLNAIKYAELLNNNFMLMRSWLSVGKLQHLQGKYITAIESLEKCIDIASENFGDSYYLSQAYETLGKAHAGNHNYEKAYQALEEYDKLKNLFLTSEADYRFSLLQTEFDVAQKETTIQIQETQIKKQRTRQTLIMITAALLFLLLSVLYITFRNNRRKNRLLERQNIEKEFLLKEIHHRVKNNLGIVSSLLSLQSALIKDPKVKNVIEDSENRVYSMSMIHQKLYQGKNIDAIEMKDYFINLGNHILDSFGASDRINIECKMKPLELGIDTAIPLGLIVNELLANSLKYAYPEERKGTITISLVEGEKKMITLQVSDNGIGKNNKVPISGTGFGSQLIQLLSKQLEAKVNEIVKDGTTYTLTFKH